MAADIDDSLVFARIDADTRTILRELAPLVDTNIETILDALYGHVLKWSHLKALFGSEERVNNARKRQREHWQRLFSAQYDADYVASVQRIAVTHARIGLQPSFYISSYLVALEKIHTLILRHWTSRITLPANRARVELAMRAADRAILYDLQLVVTGYLDESAREHRGRLAELATQFEATLEQFTTGVVTAAGTLGENATTLQTSANHATEQAAALAGGAERSSMNMQTVASATEDIRAQVSSVQNEVGQIAAAMGNIAQTVDRIREATTAIASVVEEQGAVTQEISRSVAAAAAGAGEITESARAVEAIAVRSADGARHIATASTDLTQRARGASAAFMDKIRNADRRQEPREATTAPAELLIGGVTIPGSLLDISSSGAVLRCDTTRLPANAGQGNLRIPGANIDVEMRIVAGGFNRVNMQFQDPAKGEQIAAWCRRDATAKAA